MQMRPLVWQARVKSAALLEELGRLDVAQEKNNQTIETILEIKGFFQVQAMANAFERSYRVERISTVPKPLLALFVERPPRLSGI